MGKRPWLEGNYRPIPVYRPASSFWAALTLGVFAWVILGVVAAVLGIW